MKKATSPGGAPKPTTKSPAKRAAASSAAASKKSAVNSAPASSAGSNHRTTVTARIDVGFGNLLYIRGDGPGLSWERGAPMQCTSSDVWTWTTTAATRPFAYKLLINDDRWAAGEDLVAGVGENNDVSPAF